MKTNQDSIAIYSRKSKFTGKGESVANQIELCREYILRTYGEQYAERILVYEDEGFSGGNLNRPAFKRMMDAAKDGQFSTIVVYRLDRISRNIGDFATLIQDLGRMNIGFVSLREQFDTSSPMGRAMMYIASVFSQLERETIAERIRDNMHELAKTGRWLGGTTPTGFTSESVTTVTIDGKHKKAFQLALLPDEAEIVKLIFSLYLETDSLTKTEAELLRRQIKTKSGNHFTRFGIKGILQNPVYLTADEAAYQYFINHDAELCSEPSAFDGNHGMMAYNRTDQEVGRHTKYHPISEWIVTVGKHPGLISSHDWLAVQASLERNKDKAYRKPRINEALLTGLIFCKCGSRMYPKITNRKMANGETIYTYGCDIKYRSKGNVCKCRNANGNILDKAILEQIKMLAEDKSVFRQELEKGRKLFTDDQNQLERQLASLRQEEASTQKKLDALIDSLAEAEDATMRGLITKRVEALTGSYTDVKNRITELEAASKQQELGTEEFDLLVQMLAVFSSCVDNMGLEQKRAAVRALIRKVVWDGEYAHVYLFGSPDDAQLPEPPSPPSGPKNDPETENFDDFSAEEQSKIPLCEDSERNPHVFSDFAQAESGGVPVRPHRQRQRRQRHLPAGRDLLRGHHAGAGGAFRPAAAAVPLSDLCTGRAGAGNPAAALRPFRDTAPHPAGGGRPVRHQPLLCLPH